MRLREKKRRYGGGAERRLEAKRRRNQRPRPPLCGIARAAAHQSPAYAYRQHPSLNWRCVAEYSPLPSPFGDGLSYPTGTECLRISASVHHANRITVEVFRVALRRHRPPCVTSLASFSSNRISSARGRAPAGALLEPDAEMRKARPEAGLFSSEPDLTANQASAPPESYFFFAHSAAAFIAASASALAL
jgi:hypothetical protein